MEYAFSWQGVLDLSGYRLISFTELIHLAIVIFRKY